MPVIINDFEVVVEEPAAREVGNPPAQSAPPPLRPEDFERIRRHYVQRLRRVHAD